MNRADYIDIEGGEPLENKTTGVVKYLAVAGSLAAVGFLAYSSVTSGPSTASSMTMMASSRADIPVFGSLDEDAKLRLFDDFQTKFSRKVQYIFKFK